MDMRDRKGFTLVELLVTLVILALVVGMGLTTLSFNIEKAEEKSEEVFVDTLKDAIDMYVTTNLSSLKVSDEECTNKLGKSYGTVDVYKLTKDDGSNLTFNDIIGDSNNNALVKSEFVNPANENGARFECDVDAEIELYRDDDFVYYYYVDKSDLNCLNNINDEYGEVISSLPLVSDTDGDGVKDGYYTCG